MLSPKRQPALGKIWASAQVVVANVGDSRALLIRDGKAKLRLIGFNCWRCSETLWDFLNVENAVTSPMKGTQNTDWRVYRHSATLMYLLVSHIPQKFVWNCYGNDINLKQCQMFEGDVNLELFVLRQKGNDRYIYIYKLYLYIWYCILFNWHHIYIYNIYIYMIYIYILYISVRQHVKRTSWHLKLWISTFRTPTPFTRFGYKTQGDCPLWRSQTGESHREKSHPCCRRSGATFWDQVLWWFNLKV